MPRQILKRPLLKKEVEIAYQHSRSALEASRYLKVSYKTFRKYAQMYGLFTTNQAGKGIPRPKTRGATSLNEILSGTHPNYSKKRLRERLVKAGILKNKCYLCGWEQSRADGRVPVILYLKDGSKDNLKLDNLELRCYNCIFITTGYVDPAILHIGPQVFEKDINDLVKGQDIDVASLQKEVQDQLEEESGNE